MELSEDEQRKALLLIKSGARQDFNASDILQKFHAATTPKLIQILLIHLITLARSDGYLVKKELHAIQWIARKLNYKSIVFNHLLRIIYHQDQVALSRQQQQVDSLRQQDVYSPTRKVQREDNRADYREHPVYENLDLQKVYSILGVTSEMTDDEIRRAYQKLVSQFHPDKLSGQGIPPAQLNEATERFKDIQIAYAFIKKYRSIYAGN